MIHVCALSLHADILLGGQKQRAWMQNNSVAASVYWESSFKRERVSLCSHCTLPTCVSWFQSWAVGCLHRRSMQRFSSPQPPRAPWPCTCATQASPPCPEPPRASVVFRETGASPPSVRVCNTHPHMDAHTEQNTSLKDPWKSEWRRFQLYVYFTNLRDHVWCI